MEFSAKTGATHPQSLAITALARVYQLIAEQWFAPEAYNGCISLTSSQLVLMCECASDTLIRKELRMSKVQVTTRALEGRVKRALAKEDTILKKCRVDSRWYVDLGDHYTVGLNNTIEETNIHLAALARELGVLKDYEEWAEE